MKIFNTCHLPPVCCAHWYGLWHHVGTVVFPCLLQALSWKITAHSVWDIWLCSIVNQYWIQMSASLLLKDQTRWLLFFLMLTWNSLSPILCKTYAADLVSPKYCTNVVLLVWMHLLLTYTAISEIWIKPSLCKAKVEKIFSRHTHPHGNPRQLLFREGSEVRPNEVFDSHGSQSIDAGGHCTTEGRIYTIFYLRSWNHR